MKIVLSRPIVVLVLAFAAACGSLDPVGPQNTTGGEDGGVDGGNTDGGGETPEAGSLAITTQPSPEAQSGAHFLEQPSVQLRDTGDVAALVSGVQVTAALATGTGTLGGTLTATTDATGTAAFTDLYIDGDGAHTLRFTTPGRTEAVSETVTVAKSPTLTRFARFSHTISNYPGKVDVCLEVDGAAGATPIDRAGFPDGIPYGGTSAYVAVTSLARDSLVYRMYPAPLTACPPAGSPIQPLVVGMIAWGAAITTDMDGSHWGAAPAGVTAIPPGDPASVCGPMMNEACSASNYSTGYWVEDRPDPTPDAGKASVALSSLFRGGASPLYTVCYDPDGDGPDPGVLLFDMELDGLLVGHRSVPPLTGGRLMVFQGSAYPCSTASPTMAIAVQDLPATAGDGAVASLPAGAVGRLLLVGQTLVPPSGSYAVPRIILIGP